MPLTLSFLPKLWCLFRWGGLLLPVLVLSACGGLSPARLADRGAGALARDQILLVREQPQTLGHARLLSHARQYPDLAYFIHHQGAPDFLAETSTRRQRYLILYYVRERVAYACRARAPGSHEVEFSGPHPITPREYEILSEFRARAEAGS